MAAHGLNVASAGTVLCALLALAAGQPAAGQSTEAAEVVQALTAAFNDHDPAAMVALVAEDVQIFYIDGQGRASLGIDGRDQFERQMREYFVDFPGVRSEIEAIIDGPVHVSIRERIQGGDASLAVYEVREGLVERAWYFPAYGAGRDDGPGGG